ncbi:uncharacterized protein LOC104906777 [Beta vulgaris subsp. vulgaris]|uniref:uncharacterized protein LOC104906777 n=1 Tax=Beta vulgaris subsp. vulgaris TaxID=3555 RepID=UPI00053F88E2|nr:uncharacterized protein LOC104906777 [Beta vulgaris subsp. vulgaris]
MALEEGSMNTEGSNNEGNNRGNNGGNQRGGNNGGNLDPYFIAASDNPTSSLVATVFNGVNYIRWSKNVRRALIAKNKEGFINGEILKPSVTNKVYQKWKRVDFMVVNWILSSMNVELADDFGYIDTAIDLWKELAERFGQSNGPLIYQLKKEIDNLRQENLTIVTYYGKLKKLWDEMNSLRAFPSCICGALNNCSCSFLKKLADFEDEDRMMKFLLGLNEGFDNTITNVLSMDPLPGIYRVFSITQQIEKQKEVSSMVADNNAMISSAMVAQAYKGNIHMQGRKDWRELKKEKMNKQCSHCKGKGHTADQCFQIIGYPEWYNAIKASKGNQSHGARLAANVYSTQDMAETDPLDSTNEVTGVNSDMLNAICQEVMKAMKGKQVQVGDSSGISCANYAGITSHSFNCHVNDLWIIDSGA